MRYNSEFRDFFSFSSSPIGQKYTDTLMNELLTPYGLTLEGIKGHSLKDHLLLATYLLTATSTPLCAVILPSYSATAIKSVF